MDHQILEKPDQNHQDEQQQEQEEPSKPSSLLSTTASISLSLSTLRLPLKPTTTTSVTSALPTKLKIPSQISTISLSFTSPSSSTPTKHKRSFKSTSISSFPLPSPISLFPHRPSDPTNPAALRRCSIVWFRNDLRVHDNECLTTANNESMSVLPLYCFDPRDYGKSSSGFDKTGPYRATFLIESVSDLRKNLRARGSDLVVKIGNPENVLVELVKAVGADGVYAHKEVSHDEVQAEEKIEKRMKEEGVDVKYFWGSTLYHVDDLPFKLEEMPSNYGGFRERLKGLEVRRTIAVLDELRGLPSRGDVELGEIPTLLDLGLSSNSTMAKDGKPSANASLVGGESEALQRLTKFVAECSAQPNKRNQDGGQDNIYGANFSCKISPWLTMGCLSPRFMFDELKKSAARTLSAASTPKDGSSVVGMNWLMFELLWRDFFRFITKKYSTPKKALDVTPATACTGALA